MSERKRGAQCFGSCSVWNAFIRDCNIADCFSGHVTADCVSFTTTPMCPAKKMSSSELSSSIKDETWSKQRHTSQTWDDRSFFPQTMHTTTQWEDMHAFLCIINIVYIPKQKHNICMCSHTQVCILVDVCSMYYMT